MLYFILKIWIRLTAFFFFNNREAKGKRERAPQPVVLACNHPNSFLDALLIAAWYRREVHFLARGDAFSRPRMAKLLRAMNLVPIYRLSEGKEHLKNNQQTFEECLSILKNNGTILIFSEGISANDRALRPLKKGTARIYLNGVQAGLPVKLQPVWIKYSSFDTMPKTVAINYGDPYEVTIEHGETEAAYFHRFNTRLTHQLNEISGTTAPMRPPAGIFTKFLLALPALAGWLLHAVWYIPCRRLARNKTRNTVFYDSVLFALLMLTYPIYLLLLTLLVALATGNTLSLLTLAILPVTAWCYKRYTNR